MKGQRAELDVCDDGPRQVSSRNQSTYVAFESALEDELLRHGAGMGLQASCEEDG